MEWLEYLAVAANKVLVSDKSGKSAEHQLLAYGRRRARNFLGMQNAQWPPFFGLGQNSILLGLAEEHEDERAIAYLRAIAKEVNLPGTDVYIKSDVRHQWRQNGDLRIGEYMTAVPHLCATRKRDADGDQVIEAIHARWIYAEFSEGFQHSVDSESFLERVVEERLQYLTARGEFGTWIHNVPYIHYGPCGTYGRHRAEKEELKDPPRLFKHEYQSSTQTNNTHDRNTASYCCPSIRGVDILCRCFDCDGYTTGPGYLFRFTWGIGEYGLFVKENAQQASLSALEDNVDLQGERCMQPAISAKRICNSQIKAETVLKYLTVLKYPLKAGPRSRHFNDDGGMTTRGFYTWHDTYRTHHDYNFERHTSYGTVVACLDYIAELARQWPVDMTHLLALHALTVATHVYLQLDGATISLKVVEAPLNEAPWFTELDPFEDTALISFSRPGNLACIVHFESGTVLLKPDVLKETLAIASGNSIFVINAMMSDPFETLAANSVKRIIGNIGRIGICMLVASFESKIRPLSNKYDLVEYVVYYGERENNFKSTSLYLSFIDWTLSFKVKGIYGRTID